MSGLTLFGLLLASGLPVASIVPPISTVMAVVAAPAMIIVASLLLPGDFVAGAGSLEGLRRAEAACAPRPRRTGGVSVGSQPEIVAMELMADALLEPPEGFASS